MTSAKFAVIGAGNGGLAFAGCLALRGAFVRIHDNNPALMADLAAKGTIEVTDCGQSSLASIGEVCPGLGTAVAGADIIFVVTPADTHRAIATAMAPYIGQGATVLLHPGRTGGALEVKNIFNTLIPGRRVIVGEAQTLLFACRRYPPNKVAIMGTKRRVAIATLPRNAAHGVINTLKPFFPQFAAAENILETSLGNIGAIFHPAPTVLNAARIETSPVPFRYYIDGISPSVAKILELIDAERVLVAEKLGKRVPSALEWLRQAYGISASSLHEAIQKNPAYQELIAPKTIDVRYLDEDVPTGLVPLAALAGLCGVPAPFMNAIIGLAGVIRGKDYRRTGRSLERLGLANMSADDIQAMVNT
ncbi:NAD/NADP octopine/nopaline dehydrogenase family protein [Anaeroselena agilis]|uniref:NAD/NADP octopine/nopaline dehydrogenase family protein n=1 Tax=Anaeroselena agilis TaxID=3063788 RepID=A0ABU3NTQ5_9FIRM|nr:NAD/NADP octopine/nopaline dehydrogenase family protein [Selenomonadales bacterium 4137-cl]